VRRALPYLIAAGLVFAGWHKYHETRDRAVAEAEGGSYELQSVPPPALTADSPVERPAASFAPNRSCDGRKYCSQMTSCEEATWFLQHCPGMKMDGEGDGVPCERQWCGHR